MGIGGHQVTIVVDVANVMGSRPDGWWRDRAGAAVRLHGEIARLAASGRAILPDEPGPAGEAEPPGFVMVLEGAARAAAARIEPGEVGIVQARGSGDDEIVAVVRELARAARGGNRRSRTAREVRGGRRGNPRAGLAAGPAACPEPPVSRGFGPPGPFNRAAPLPL